jgi:hypothetical protein
MVRGSDADILATFDYESLLVVLYAATSFNRRIRRKAGVSRFPPSSGFSVRLPIEVGSKWFAVGRAGGSTKHRPLRALAMSQIELLPLSHHLRLTQTWLTFYVW